MGATARQRAAGDGQKQGHGQTEELAARWGGDHIDKTTQSTCHLGRSPGRATDPLLGRFRAHQLRHRGRVRKHYRPMITLALGAAVRTIRAS
jgi:hypothetical protein